MFAIKDILEMIFTMLAVMAVFVGVLLAIIATIKHFGLFGFVVASLGFLCMIIPSSSNTGRS